MNRDLSPHFTLREFTRSQTAERRGVANTPDERLIGRLEYLCAAILEPCRSRFGPIVVTSGYRRPELNELIGGSPNSQHCRAEAADFEAVAATVGNRELAGWIAANLAFDQLILECYTPGGDPRSGWVHCSVGPRERRQVLTYRRGAGYTEGLSR